MKPSPSPSPDAQHGVQGAPQRAPAHLLAAVVLLAFRAGAFFCWACLAGGAALAFFSSSDFALCLSLSLSLSLSFFFLSFSFFSFFLFGLFTGA